MKDLMTLSQNLGMGSNAKRAKRHWLVRYGFAVFVFLAVAVLATVLSALFPKINQTIPIVVAIVAVAWYAGRGPGLILGGLLQTTTIIYIPIPPDSSVGKAVFGWLSTFALYAFLVFVISGLREKQLRLAEQRDLLDVTLSSIGDAVIATDKTGRVTFMNPTAQEMTGWLVGEAYLLPLEKVARIISEETRQELINPVTKVLASGISTPTTNHSLLVARNGGEIPIVDTAAPIQDNGVIRGAVLVFSDVTELKRAERSRREREIMQRLVEAQESERHRIARDLHDHLGQKMTALRLQIEGLSDRCGDNEPLRHVLEQVKVSASGIDGDIGFLSWELRPTELEELGLLDALSSFVRAWSQRHRISAEFHGDVSANVGAVFSKSDETNLYRIVQEALNNILKHAGATTVNVLFHHKRDHIILIIEDDGRGFDSVTYDSQTPHSGELGLMGMRERAAIMNGNLDIDSTPGSGTTIIVRIPLPAPLDV